MTPFEAYTEYTALKQHFTRPTYDYFKYHGKIKSSKESFEKRKDKIFFQKLSKHPDIHNFLVANFIVNEKSWIKDLAYSTQAEDVYISWIKQQQSLTYSFKEDLSKLDETFNSNFICPINEHPKLLKIYMGNEISFNTLCILLQITDAKSYWDKMMKDDVVWSKISIKLNKYLPFLNYDIDKIKKICLDKFI